MTDRYSRIDRLEARVDYQAAEIDALYHALERRGIITRPVDAETRDAPHQEARVIEQPRRVRPVARRAKGFHLGDATGV